MYLDETQTKMNWATPKEKAGGVLGGCIYLFSGAWTTACDDELTYNHTEGCSGEFHVDELQVLTKSIDSNSAISGRVKGHGSSGF